MHTNTLHEPIRSLMRLTCQAICALLLVGCTSANQNRANDPGTPGRNLSPQAQFDAAIARNFQAANKHFWDAFDCKNRDPENGLLQSAIKPPGTVRNYMDSTEYTAHYFFPKQGLGKEDLHAFVIERVQAAMPKTYKVSRDGKDAEFSRIEKPNDAVSVSIMVGKKLLHLVFHPALSVPIPWGNPCAAPPNKRP